MASAMLHAYENMYPRRRSDPAAYPRKALKLLLTRGAGVAEAELENYSVHSFRIFVACALLAAGALRWLIPALRSSVAEAAALISRCATPPSPSAGARSTPFAPSLSSSAQRTTSSTSPLPPRRKAENVRSYAGSTCRRPGAQRPRLRRRASTTP